MGKLKYTSNGVTVSDEVTITANAGTSSESSVNVKEKLDSFSLKQGTIDGIDFLIEDANGNVIVAFANGHIITKNFDSSLVIICDEFGSTISIIRDGEHWIIDDTASFIVDETNKRGLQIFWNYPTLTKMMQSVAIYQNYALATYGGGYAALHTLSMDGDYVTADHSNIIKFQLDCIEDDPHCNASSFGPYKNDAGIPYFYANKMDGGNKCYVESLSGLTGTITSTTVQTIYADFTKINTTISNNANMLYQYVIDEDGYIYCVCNTYTQSSSVTSNMYVYKFRQVRPEEGNVVFDNTDIIASYVDTNHNQGSPVQDMKCHKGMLYVTNYDPASTTSYALLQLYDCTGDTITKGDSITIPQITTDKREIEGIAHYNGNLLIFTVGNNTEKDYGRIYQIKTKSV